MGGLGNAGLGPRGAALPFPSPRGGMLPWPYARWDADEEQEPEEQGPSPCSDPIKSWNSGGEALGEPGTPPQESPQSLSPRPSWTQREQPLAPLPSSLVAEQTPGAPDCLGGGPLKDDPPGTMGPQL